MSDRHARYSSIITPDGLNAQVVGVAGCGAVGRQVLLQLTAMGQRGIHLADFDIVETVNLGPQGWSEDSVGRLKAREVARDMERLAADSKPTVYTVAFPDGRPLNVLFLCVDTFAARYLLAQEYGRTADLIIDARVGGEAIRIFTVDLRNERDRMLKAYLETTGPGRRSSGVSCTARSTIYMANIAASLMVNQYVHWVQGREVDPVFWFLLGSLEISKT